MSALVPLILAAAVPLQAPTAPSAALTCALPTIEAVQIVRHDVFESTGEESWLYRTVNNLHVRTREVVVRRELLFAPGDRMDLEALAQSERNLRATRFLSAVQIELLDVDGALVIDPSTSPLEQLCAAVAEHESVIVRVTTHDSWSTSLEITFRKAGDEFIFGIGLQENNFLGRGKTLLVFHRDDIDRTSNAVAYTDPRLAGTRLALRAEYADQSDGGRGVAEIGQSFYALDTKWSYSARVESFDQEDPLYFAGDEVSRLRHVRQWQEVSVARLLRQRGSRALRFHVAYRRRYDDVSVDTRRFGILEVGLSSDQHAFREYDHLNHERTEDVNLGTQSELSLGFSSTALGGSGSALFLSASHERGIPLGDARFVLARASWDGRLEHRSVRNGIGDASVTLVDLSASRRVLLLSARYRHGTRLDPEVQVTLGAQNGLRGYGVHQFVGTRSLLLSAERRWFLIDNLARVFSLGLAAFIDSGYAWTQAESLDLGDLKTNLGISLLLGRRQVSTDRAGTRIDLAYALDPVYGRSHWLLSFGNITQIEGNAR